MLDRRELLVREEDIFGRMVIVRGRKGVVRGFFEGAFGEAGGLIRASGVEI